MRSRDAAIKACVRTKNECMYAWERTNQDAINKGNFRLGEGGKSEESKHLG